MFLINKTLPPKIILFSNIIQDSSVASFDTIVFDHIDYRLILRSKKIPKLSEIEEFFCQSAWKFPISPEKLNNSRELQLQKVLESIVQSDFDVFIRGGKNLL